MTSPAICHRIARSLSGRPLWMEPGAFRLAFEAIAPKLGITKREAASDSESPAAQQRQAVLQRLSAIVDAEPVDVAEGMGEYGVTPGGIAVIPIVGTLIDRYDWLAAWCGLTSYDALKVTLRAAASDVRVLGILLDIDSPGGAATGMLDCADEIRAIAGAKPIWASANSLATSAGYGLGAAAQRLTLPRMGTVGSVGVVGVHIDQSAYDRSEGLRYTPIYSGAQKIDGWGHAPLSAGARDRIQAMFDESRRKFAEAVGVFRNLSTEAVLATEAGFFDDDQAVGLGFADSVQSFDDTLAELSDFVRGPEASGSRTAQSASAPKEATMAQPRNRTARTAPKPAATAPAPASAAAAAPAKEEEEPGEDPAEEAEESPAEEAAEEETEPKPGQPLEEEADEDGKKAALTSAADIAELCAKNGVPQLAGDLIRSGATLEEAKTRINAAGEIRALVATARKTNAAIDPALADELIAQNATVPHARKLLFERLTASGGGAVSSTIGTGVGQGGATAKSRAPLDSKAIYDRMNRIGRRKKD